jgi:chromosome segregation ATPase
VTDLAATREQLSAVAARVAVLEGEVQQLREARHDHAGQINSLSLAVSSIKATIEKLEPLLDEVASMRGDMNSMQIQMGALKAEVQGLNGGVEQVANAIGSMHADVIATRSLSRKDKLLVGIGAGGSGGLVWVIVEAIQAALRHAQ